MQRMIDATVGDSTGGPTYAKVGPGFEVPPGSLMMTLGEPAPAGVLAVNSLLETNFTSVAAAPIATVAPATNPLPLIVTAVPPMVGPVLGMTDATVGGGR